MKIKYSISKFVGHSTALRIPGGASGNESACQFRRQEMWVLSPGEGHGNPLCYSSQKSSMDRGAWWDTVHRIARSWTQLK